MLIMVANTVFADNEATGTTATSVIDNLKNQIDGHVEDPTEEGDLTAKIGKIIGVLQWVGIIAGVGILAVFGIKYMMGSVEEKAEYKKSLVPLLVGAVLVFGAAAIARIIIGLAESFTTNA